MSISLNKQKKSNLVGETHHIKFFLAYLIHPIHSFSHAYKSHAISIEYSITSNPFRINLLRVNVCAAAVVRN